MSDTGRFALVFHGPRNLSWEPWPDGDLAPGHAVFAPNAIGICGSDLHGYLGESGRRRAPMVMGHEAAGRVVQVGEGVGRDWVGRAVALQPFVACGRCSACSSGATNLCSRRSFFGATMDGAMAESLVVPLANLVPLPEGMRIDHAALAEPYAVALHAVERAGDLGGRSVFVAGAGPIGLLISRAARERGAAIVAITDVNPVRLGVARSMGADIALPPGEWRSAFEPMTGVAGVDIAFDAVGIEATFGQVVTAVVPGGTVVAVGGWKTVPLDLTRVVASEITLRGAFNFLPRDFDQAIMSIARDPDFASAVISERAPLASGAELFARMTDSAPQGIKYMLVQGERA